MTDARGAAAKSDAHRGAFTVPPTLLAAIPGKVSGSVDAYRLQLVCPCGEKVPYPTTTATSVCVCGTRWSVGA